MTFDVDDDDDDDDADDDDDDNDDDDDDDDDVDERSMQRKTFLFWGVKKRIPSFVFRISLTICRLNMEKSDLQRGEVCAWKYDDDDDDDDDGDDDGDDRRIIPSLMRSHESGIPFVRRQFMRNHPEEFFPLQEEKWRCHPLHPPPTSQAPPTPFQL